MVEENLRQDEKGCCYCDTRLLILQKAIILELQHAQLLREHTGRCQKQILPRMGKRGSAHKSTRGLIYDHSGQETEQKMNSNIHMCRSRAVLRSHRGSLQRKA